MHVVAVVWREPHEVRREIRVEIVDESAVCCCAGRIQARICKNYVLASGRIVDDVCEGNKRVMLVFVNRGGGKIASGGSCLIFHVSLPS